MYSQADHEINPERDLPAILEAFLRQAEAKEDAKTARPVPNRADRRRSKRETTQRHT
jgi:hypothetical protein